jgi:hypothetical protein
MSEKFLSKSGNYFSQIVELKACEYALWSAYYTHIAKCKQLFCKAYHIKVYQTEALMGELNPWNWPFQNKWPTNSQVSTQIQQSKI